LVQLDRVRGGVGRRLGGVREAFEHAT